MKAVAYLRYGGPEVTRVIDAPRPVAGPDEVLVRVTAAGLNPVDALQRDGAFRAIRRYRFPVIGGNEFSGTVAAVGTAVSGFAVGDRVIARVDKAQLAAFAEWALVRQGILAGAPQRLSLAESAALPLAGLTALQGLGKEHLDVASADRLLITGGAGGVGILAIQLAKLSGAHVTTTASAAGEDLVRWAGADAVIDYRRRSISQGGERFDKVLDLVGGDTLTDLIGSVERGGRIVSISGPATPGSFDDELGWARRPIISAALALQSRRMRGLARRAHVTYSFFFMRPDGAQLKRLAELVDAGALHVVIDSRYAFTDVAAAFDRLESRRAKGKVILEFDDLG
jgi:NADPH:quinone reductase and related Zn-dependent oxidoreductases